MSNGDPFDTRLEIKKPARRTLLLKFHAVIVTAALPRTTETVPETDCRSWRSLGLMRKLGRELTLMESLFLK